MRDKFYGKPNVGLLVTPGFTEDEMHVAKALARQLPPLANPVYGKPKVESEKLEKECKRFQSSVDKILKGRSTKAKTSWINVIVGELSFMDAQIQGEILEDLKGLPLITSVSVVPEFVTSEIRKVRLEVHLRGV
jgi:hypothetical protein